MWCDTHMHRVNSSPVDRTDSNSASVTPADLLRVAVAVAETAAEHVRVRRPEVFGVMGARVHGDDGQSVRAKSTPTDPVTVVDTEAEQLIRGLLAELRPQDAVLGEEGGGARDVPEGCGGWSIRSTGRSTSSTESPRTRFPSPPRSTVYPSQGRSWMSLRV